MTDIRIAVPGGLRDPGAGDVTAFLTAGSRWLAPKTTQQLATALRSLLRFRHLRGGPLDRAVPGSPTAGLGFPRPLESRQLLLA